MAKLGEICNIVSGATPKTNMAEYWNGDFLWITPAELNDRTKYVYTTDRKITQLAIEKTALRVLPKGTVLLSSRAPIGKVAITAAEMFCNQGFKNLICTNLIFNEYLFWFLKSKTAYLNSLGRGATFKEISRNIVEKIEIPLPSLEQQHHIVNTLDKINELIDLKKRQLQLLDDLVKARFIELFGDPISNPKGWKTEKTETHIDLISGFPFDSSLYTESGVNICGGLIIMPQRIDWNDCKHWCSIEGYEEYTLKENDIVMALDRPWISEGFKIAMVDAEHLPALLIQRTARIRAIDINQRYLMYCFLIGGFDKHCNVTGSLVPHISAKDIRSFTIMLPPVELQKQFAAFVKQTNKSKFIVQKALDEAQLLFDSLMQKYFN